ncbi:MAG: hypothetical protein EB127_07240 [Alphaproteobacteria bacterium]|nr:hypothetical protein [Alphaproteobacteria bacterium]
MEKVYLIKPLEKKSIIYHVEMYRNNADGTVSWFNLDETYRWGQGFVEEDMDINLPIEGDQVAYCDPSAGWGCEFDDSINVELEFSEDISEQEQEEIREAYYEGGAGWLFDGEHDWLEEDSSVHIYAPYQVSLCSDDGAVLIENVKLKTREELADEIRQWHRENGSKSFQTMDENLQEAADAFNEVFADELKNLSEEDIPKITGKEK